MKTEGSDKDKRQDIEKDIKQRKMMEILAGVLIALAVLGVGYLGYRALHNSKDGPGMEQTQGGVTTSSLSAETEQTSTEVQTKMLEKTTEIHEETPEETPEETTEEVITDPKQLALKPFKNLGIITNVNHFLNLRKGPSTEDDIIGKIFEYCGVDVLDETADGWYKVTSGGATGYVAKQYVVTGQKAVDLGMECSIYRAEILEDGTNVYTSPDTSSAVITPFLKGNAYDILEETEDWVKVEAFQYVEGYIRKSQVKLKYCLDEAVVFTGYDELSQTRKDIINMAFDYYGGKYVWGGEQLGVAVDCSGYTQQIYKHFGVDMIHRAAVQVGYGVEVSQEDARPGDLIFYYGSEPSVVGHVGIYIGSHKIIHAASEEKGIIVSNWDFVPIVMIRNVLGD